MNDKRMEKHLDRLVQRDDDDPGTLDEMEALIVWLYGERWQDVDHDPAVIIPPRA